MTKNQKLTNIKLEIRDRMVQAIFEPLVLTHLEAMERSQSSGELFHLGDHVWKICRTQSIWTIRCDGPDAWEVQFDEGWRTGSAGDRYQAIDTFVFKENVFMNTHMHLKMALAFVSSYLVNTNPDGTIANYNSEI